MNGVTVTAYSPYQAYPGPAPVPVAQPSQILVAVADPVPQRRVTVAFRILLAVPHLFVLYWLILAAGVVAFLGWWAALFTGRLPQFAVDFLSGCLRWETRVFAYGSLLTDVYPPFTLNDDPRYPVRVAIPERRQLNRFEVFFRFAIILPVAILAAIVTAGAGTLMAFIAWLITLVAGQLPAPLHLAFTAVLRFRMRVMGYWVMLTPAYPGGLYGDKPGATAWADEPPGARAPDFGRQAPGFGAPGPGYGTPSGYGTPGGYGTPSGYGTSGGYGTPSGYGTSGGYGTPSGYGTAGGYGAPVPGYGAPGGYGAPVPGYGPGDGYGAPAPGYGAPVPGYDPQGGYGAPAGYDAPGGYAVRPAFQPATWLLRLTSAAKKLVTTFIVLGALFVGCEVAVYSIIVGATVKSAGDTATALSAIQKLNDSATTLSNTLSTWEQATTNCDQNLACVTKQDTKGAAAFTQFSSQLENTSVPARAAAAKARVNAASIAAAQDFVQLSKATTAAQYQATFGRIGLQQTLNGWYQDVNALVKELETN